MFSVQNFGNQNSSNQQGKFIRPLPGDDMYNVEKFDLSVTIDDSRQELTGLISYATALFSITTIKRIINQYLNLLRQLTASPNTRYSQINIMDDVEFDKVVYKWNSTEKYYPKEKTISQLFEEQVERSPENCALVFEGKQMSFRELNETSNQLAKHIRQVFRERNNSDLIPDTLIALYVERSIEMVVAIMAVLKTGAAYVPMDISYPQERIDFLLTDTNAPIILNLRRQKSKVRLPEEKVICIDLSESIYNGENTNPHISCNPKNLAYVIYTSGTTGRPKGVMVEHGAFSQFVYNFNDLLREEPDTKISGVLSLTNYVFDIFGLEYALPLITGTTITLSSIDKVTANEISENQIIQQTPGSLFHFAANFSEKLKTNICLVGGEALSPNVAARLLQSFKKVFNVYGPAETVIWSSIHEITDPEHPYIGKPLFNEQVYVLDGQLQPSPIGVTGELYIGGAGLAKGYLNLPDLTKERFIANPFATDEGKAKGYARLYKTGDLVRWQENGILEFIGRNDDQVKVRGHRIELAEVSNALSGIHGIHESCVLAKVRTSGNGIEKYLVAYYIPDTLADNITNEFISSELLKVLPEYMLPDAFVAMAKFPLTVNGKLDKKALPDPGFQNAIDSYSPPATKTEQSICSLWQEVLGLECVGTTDDFFRIGGNSISAIQVSHMMSRLLSCELKVADIFKYKTIAHLLKNSLGQEMIHSRLYFLMRRKEFGLLSNMNKVPTPIICRSCLRSKRHLTWKA
jgi:amino acid adenylation domain-containing protein